MKSRRFATILDYVERVCAREGHLCDAELIPRLRGLEGRRVLLVFDDGRRMRCLIGQRRVGALVVHVAKRNEQDRGEPLTFGDVRLVQVLDQPLAPGGGELV